jgi:hypothetical protein
MKLLDGEVLPGDSLTVDTDPAKRDQMSFACSGAKVVRR